MAIKTKQELYALYLFQGMSQAEAYKKAGYSGKAITTITANACRLAKTDSVKNKVAELRAKAESSKIMSVIERKEMLTLIARFGGKLSIPAIAELNKMGGDYAPTNNEKQNLNVNVNVGVFQAKDLTDDQLLDIINRGGGHRAIEQKASKESATAILPVHDVNIREGEASIPSS